jgi:glutamate-1-semialdehyde 2,1-aminomutase
MGRAARVMPGGNTRTTAHYPPFPLLIDHADGPFLWDADGNRLIDLLVNYTSLVHGHRFPPVLEAVEEVLAHGTAWPAASRWQIDLASLLCERIDSVERVRFCNSGTEAGLLAVRLARRATGRRLLLKAEGGYHGSYDELDAGPETLQAPYGDAGAFLRTIAAHAHELAAVVLEPVMVSAGVISPPAGFLTAVADATRATGAVFVLDEVVTLRLGVGGAQEAVPGLRPDLTMMGKIIGGGFPVGAVGGRADLVDLLDPRRPTALPHSGTFNGNPVTCAAGAAAVRALDAAAVERLAEAGERLHDSLEASAARHGLDVPVARAGSLLHLDAGRLAGSDEPDLGPADRFHLEALEQGLFLAPRGMIALSTAVGADLLDEICRRFDAVFARLAAA